MDDSAYSLADTLRNGERSWKLLDSITNSLEDEVMARVWTLESDLINFAGKVLAEVTAEGSYRPESTHKPGSWRKETVENQVNHARDHIKNAPMTTMDGQVFLWDKAELRHALWRVTAALYLLEYGVDG